MACLRTPGQRAEGATQGGGAQARREETPPPGRRRRTTPATATRTAGGRWAPAFGGTSGARTRSRGRRQRLRAAGSFVDRMAASFQAPRLVGSNEEDAAPRRAPPAAPSHWTRGRQRREVGAGSRARTRRRAATAARPTSGRRCTAARWSSRWGRRRLTVGVPA